MANLNKNKGVIDELLNNSKMEIDRDDDECNCFFVGGKCIRCGKPDPVFSESYKE